MNTSKALKVFMAIVAFLNSMTFLAIWMVIVVVGYSDDLANNFTGYLINWVSGFIDLLMIGEPSDYPRFHMLILLLFPAIFTYVPIKICQFIYRRFGGRHVNQ